MSRSISLVVVAYVCLFGLLFILYAFSFHTRSFHEFPLLMWAGLLLLGSGITCIHEAVKK
jgi:drug/metabolite transporter (DMT)-like permease